MANKTFCPIMAIGFDPPEKGKRDNRVCMKDCAWYNVSEERCAISIIAEAVSTSETFLSDIADYLVELTYKTEEDYDYPAGFDEEPEDYYGSFSKRT